MSECTKAGRLEEAIAVREVIASREVGAKSRKWVWGSGGVLELKVDGTATHTSWNKPGTWKAMRDGTIKLVSHFGESTLTLAADGSGIVKAAKGGSTTITPLE